MTVGVLLALVLTLVCYLVVVVCICPVYVLFFVGGYLVFLGGEIMKWKVRECLTRMSARVVMLGVYLRV